VSAGVTAAQALEGQRRKHHELEGRKLGIPRFETAGETAKKPALHVAITKYLEQIEALKKPDTHRKYEAVLKRFGEFFRDSVSIDAISGDDLTCFVVTLKKPPIEIVRNHERASEVADLYHVPGLSLLCSADRRTGRMQRNVNGQLLGFGIEVSLGVKSRAARSPALLGTYSLIWSSAEGSEVLEVFAAEDHA
jgi:hypothetical protein